MFKLHLTGIETAIRRLTPTGRFVFKLYLTGLETGWREGHHRCRGSSNCTLLELKLVCEPHSLVRISEDEMNLYR